MSTEQPSTPITDADAKEIDRTKVEDEMEQSYIDYAMSVIAGRALPDVRDGLKPVHRRILYAMYDMGVSSGSSHRKSSSIVGETMGDYHPHGDSAIYDTLVRMAQDFSMRHPLVDGQGNFGSLDGDPAAAMRYTESRMSPVGEALLNDIDKDTVEWSSNYDDRLQEPDVLPASFPNLLVNGASGIAVGMSTSVPPHNLGEVVDGTIHLIDNPDADTSDLMEHIPGPDFPTGATIVGRDSIYDAYDTGRGRLTVRADYTVESNESGRDKIIINELPYHQKKAKLVEKIADDVNNSNDDSLTGIADLRDESDRDGVRIVIEVKNNAQTDVVENYLIDNHLEKTVSVINLALVDGEPRVLTLKQMLEEYIQHRKDVVRRRSEYELQEAEDRSHILEGRLTAFKNAEDVVELIKDSDSRDDAKGALKAEYGFSEEQANHIVRMQLGSLTSMEGDEIREEYEEVQNEIDRLETILGDEDELLAVIKDELRDVKDEYADERRTDIIEDTGSVTREDLVPDEDVVVVRTQDGYLKSMSVDTFDPQSRGGKGVIGADVKEGDEFADVFTANKHDTILFVTDDGTVLSRKAYRLPEMSRTARGSSAQNVLGLGSDQSIVGTVVVSDAEFDRDDLTLTFLTESGTVKRTRLSQFKDIRSTGIIGIETESDDRVIAVDVASDTDHLVVASSEGQVIRFPASEARVMGRTARGVAGMKLTGGAVATDLTVVEPDSDTDTQLLTVTENGYGKRTPVSEYRAQSRNGKGLVGIDTGDRNGAVAAIHSVSGDEHLYVTTTDAQAMRTRVSEVSEYGRNTSGVITMRVSDSASIAGVEPYVPKADDEDEPEEE